MAMLHESLASLRIAGDSLEPSEITELLGCEPTHSGSMDELRVAKVSGRERRLRTGGWSLSAKVAKPGDIDGQAKEILGKLNQDLEVWRSLSSRFKIDLFCGLMMKESNEGLSLSSKTLNELGSRGIQLDMCLYGPLKADLEQQDL